MNMAAIHSRYLSRRLACLMAGLLLFTQLALAAQACMLPRPNPAHAFSDAMATEPCEGVPMNRAICLADCLKADQASLSIDYHFDLILPQATPLAEWYALQQVDPSARVLAVSRCPIGPPLQILFCSFQT